MNNGNSAWEKHCINQNSKQKKTLHISINVSKPIKEHQTTKQIKRLIAGKISTIFLASIS